MLYTRTRCQSLRVAIVCLYSALFVSACDSGSSGGASGQGADSLDAQNVAGSSTAEGTAASGAQSVGALTVASSNSLANTVTAQGTVPGATGTNTDAAATTDATVGVGSNAQVLSTTDLLSDAVLDAEGNVLTDMESEAALESDSVGTGSIYNPVFSTQAQTVTIDGRASLAVVAVGGSLLQSPRARVEQIDEYDLNNANQIAFTGSYSIADESVFGVWAGNVSQPEKILETGELIPGLSEGQTYYKTEHMLFGADGTVAQIVEVRDAGTISQAYLVSDGAQHTVLMQSDTSASGLFGAVQLDAIELADRSGNAHALVTIERIETVESTSEAAEAAEAAEAPEAPDSETEPAASADDDELAPSVNTMVTPQYSIWYHNGGALRPVAHSWVDTAQAGPSLGNGCRVYAPDNTVDNVRMSVTDNGQLIFQAQIGGDGDCEQGRAVLRYNGASYQEMVKDGDTVPGAPDYLFDDVSLYTVTEDGSAIVFANLLTPEALAIKKSAKESDDEQFDVIGSLADDVDATDDVDDADTDAADVDVGADLADELNTTEEVDTQATTDMPAIAVVAEEAVEPDDGLWSFWLLPPQGGARLIVMEGEEVQVGAFVSTFSGEPRSLSLQVNENNRIALKVTFDRTEQPAYFVGTGHNGQPHVALDAPGASALQYAFTANSTLPGQSNDAELGSLGEPYLDSQGNLVIHGEVGPSELALLAAADSGAAQGAIGQGSGLNSPPLVTPFNSIWQVDEQGSLRELVRSGDVVIVNGESKPLASLSVNGQIARPGSSGIRLNRAGAMLLRASIDQRFGAPVLLYVAP